ncbi:hypothetical protein EPN52_07775 [bacterium]|nr:MAG: hypothetical protein EPN52_07775 [bacterium]
MEKRQRVEELLNIPFGFSRGAGSTRLVTTYDEAAAGLAAHGRAIVRVRAEAGAQPATLPAGYPFGWMATALGRTSSLACVTSPFVEARPISFVVITHRPEVLERHLAASPVIGGARHQLITVANPRSAAAGLNAGLAQAAHAVVAFVHHDVYLPPWWESQLETALRDLDRRDPEWGVLGPAGARLEGTQLHYAGSLLDGTASRRWGFPWGLPVEVDTLDELTLIVRREAGLRFDETLAGFHAYGTQLALAARARGLRNYAILAECEHRSESSGWSPDAAYFAAHAQVAKRWSRRPYGAMFGAIPWVLPAPWREAVVTHYGGAAGSH